jgi:hypothetical protein
MFDKCKIVPVLNETPRHKDVWVNEGIATLLTSAIDEGERSASRPCRFIPSKTADTCFVGGWTPPYSKNLCLVRLESEEAKWSVALYRENYCGRIL